MHREHLHPAGPLVDVSRSQPVLPFVGGGEVVQQLGQPGTGPSDVGDDIGERVQVRPALSVGDGYLDVEADGALHVGDQVAERLP